MSRKSNTSGIGPALHGSCGLSSKCERRTCDSITLTDCHSKRRLNSPFVVGVTGLLPLVLLRITRSWNQTGQKYAGSPDIAKHVLPLHRQLTWFLVLSAYIWFTYRLSEHTLPRYPRWIATSLSIILGVSSLIFKTTFTLADAPELLTGLESFVPQMIRDISLVSQARLVFATAFILAIGTTLQVAKVSVHGDLQASESSKSLSFDSRPYLNDVDCTHSIHGILTLCLLTQTRAVNIPLFLLFDVQAYIISLMRFSATEVSVTTLLFQHVAFFSFGGSNAISSIDLSNAYNGVSGYNIGAVGLLTFLGNWAGPIWWSSATHAFLSSRRESQAQVPFVRSLSYTMAFSSASTLAVMMACAALRSHLFIWTVFSPKYLYAMAWYFGQAVCVDIWYGSLLYMLGRMNSSKLNV